jgi:ATP-binding cassette subfamily B protein
MTRETLKLFWRATWRYKWLVLFGEASAILFSLADSIASPYLISRIIDKLTEASSQSLTFRDFEPLLWLFLLTQVVYFVSARGMMRSFIRYETRAVRDLENLCFRKLQSHSMAFFADNFGGALVAKVNRLTGAYQRVIETVTGDFASLTYKYIASLIIIFLLNPAIAMVFFGWSVVFGLSLIYLHRRRLKHSRAAADSQTRVTARLADTITNTLTIRSFARSDEETKRFEELTDERHHLRFRAFIVGDYIRIYKTLTIAILEVVILALSIHFGLKGTLSIGSIVLIQLYLRQLLTQLWNLGRFMDRIEEALADATEMTEIIMQPHEVIDPATPLEPAIHDGSIAFNDVNFRYADGKGQELLFKDFDLVIPAGQKVGVVGPSGGGKTTLTKLLLRFMDIQSGEILIDGQNIAQLRQADVRANIAYVPQEPLLFHRTIHENIVYGDLRADRSKVIRAAKLAHAHEFIKALPKTYGTMVGERGVKLSGGQRQRIALARAMLKKAPIIVLDEATSSLDSVSEKLITEALDNLMERRTTLVIAHRLSTIRKLDRILVIDEGRIIEDGTHQELLKRKGLYARLWAHQSGDFLGED